MPLKRSLRFLALACGVSFVSLVLYLWYIQATGNFGTVVEGKVYRSNQITPERMAQYQAEHGIRSVLNLRGAKPGEGWYDAEVQAAADLDIQLINFGMSADKEVSDEQIDSLLALMRDAPKPLLIHCKSGADRTGIASTMYLAVIEEVDEEEAEWQLSPLYGHLPIPILSRAWPMDVSWEYIEVKVLGLLE